MTEKMIDYGQFAEMAGISKTKMFYLFKYHAVCLPKPVISKIGANGKFLYYWEESEVLNFLAHTSLKNMKGSRDVNKKSENKHKKLLITLFVNRKRPKIEHGALILKYQCHRSTQHLKERDAPRLRQFDNNFEQAL